MGICRTSVSDLLPVSFSLFFFFLNGSFKLSVNTSFHQTSKFIAFIARYQNLEHPLKITGDILVKTSSVTLVLVSLFLEIIDVC